MEGYFANSLTIASFAVGRSSGLGDVRSAHNRSTPVIQSTPLPSFNFSFNLLAESFTLGSTLSFENHPLFFFLCCNLVRSWRRSRLLFKVHRLINVKSKPLQSYRTHLYICVGVISYLTAVLYRRSTTGHVCRFVSNILKEKEPRNFLFFPQRTIMHDLY